MKNIGITLLMLVPINLLSAQNRASIWQLGLNNFGTLFPAQEIVFSGSSADTNIVYRSLSMFNSNASICDTSGQLLFYTNGVYIANRNHDSLANCQNFNPGYWTDFYGHEGMGIPQGILILPKPGDNNRYGIFSVTGELGDFYGKTFASLRLSYSEVDITLDGGLGGILTNKKNINLVEDTLTWGRLIATKHANGRDWWIVTHEYYSDRYFKLYYTPDTIIKEEQFIGNLFNSFDANGMAVFSPDGTKYAHLNINDTIDLMQFDRCSGEFYNPISLAVPDSPVTLSATLGCQFSPNSRFLYVNSYRRLWQFDTWANDIQASLILIDTTNNFEDKFLQQLAPDGKIYISTFNSNGQDPFLNVINNPDSLGISCNFVVAGMRLPPAATNTSIPNFPNYDLGALIGSPCDTLTTVDEIKGSPTKITISPNPANQIINIVYDVENECLFEIIDAKGVVRKKMALFPYFKNRMIWVNDLENGIYFYSVVSDNVVLKTGKIAVVR